MFSKLRRHRGIYTRPFLIHINSTIQHTFMSSRLTILSRFYQNTPHHICQRGLIIITISSRNQRIRLFRILNRINFKRHFSTIINIFITARRTLRPPNVSRTLQQLNVKPIMARRQPTQSISGRLQTINRRTLTGTIRRQRQRAAKININLSRRQQRHQGRPNLLRPHNTIATSMPHRFTTTHKRARRHRINSIRIVRRLHRIINMVIRIVAIPQLAKTTVPTPVVNGTTGTINHRIVRLHFPAINIRQPAITRRRSQTTTPVLMVSFRIILNNRNTRNFYAP